MDVSVYDEKWPEWNDFIRYNPGARHRRRLALKLIEGLSFKDILDVGCGNAEFLSVLKKEYPDAALSGADISGEIIKQNQESLPGIPFHVLNIEKEKVAGEFDLVACCEVIEHLEDRRRGLTNLRDMVRPGGYLLITCPTGRVYSTERYFGHTSHPTVIELESYAAELGLKVVRLQSWGWPFYSALKWATNINPDWALRKFASGKYSFSSKIISNFLFGLNYLNFHCAVRSMGCQLFVLLKRN